MPTQEPEETAPTATTEEQPTLGAILNEKKAAFLEKADSEKIASYDAGLKAVEESGILSSALNVGDKAHDFTLNNQTGAAVKLSDLLKNGPVILTWYRGGWCPYCNITLAFLQEKLPEFKAAGGQLIALTPELPDSSMSTTEKHALEFDVLSDVGNKVARNFGVVFKLTADVAARYQKGFNLHAYNGDETDELPLAATYVIGTDGIIHYAFLDVDYRNRAEPSAILAALNKLK
ncbi:MAG: AhpC/TSA family protein [Flavobacteriales bacterium]|nr:AhpC/TSA family protein [Flavobacteriales bacterium]